MIYYNNRELSNKLAINNAKWKRWVREFLPPDPLGGRQSGYARQINRKDAFKVYLGGHLVSQLKFSIPEARIILADLHPWLKQQGYFGLQLAQRVKVLTDLPHYLIYIYDNPKNGFAFAIREIIDTDIAENSALKTEKYHTTFLGLTADWLLNCEIPSARVLSITCLGRQFIKEIDA